jgi:hypothetical protein
MFESECRKMKDLMCFEGVEVVAERFSERAMPMVEYN